MENKKQLILDIVAFIDKYAKISPNYLPEEDDGDLDGKYTGPDPYELLYVANCLKANVKPVKCWSDWSSGCYRYNIEGGFELHQSLLERIYKIIHSK